MRRATASQASCLREEITTCAPCSASRSAMARPMPREEPVTMAVLPVRSKRVMPGDPAGVFQAGRQAAGRNEGKKHAGQKHRRRAPLVRQYCPERRKAQTPLYCPHPNTGGRDCWHIQDRMRGFPFAGAHKFKEMRARRTSKRQAGGFLIPFACAEAHKTRKMQGDF